MAPSEYVDLVIPSLNKGGSGSATDRFGEAEHSWNCRCHRGAGRAKPWEDAVHTAADTPWQ